MAGQMRDLHPWKNQKPRIVGDHCQSLLRAKSSVFEIQVPACAAPGRGTKKQCSHFPSRAVPGQIPDVLAHYPKPQIMVVRQIIRPSPMRLRPRSHNLQARRPQPAGNWPPSSPVARRSPLIECPLSACYTPDLYPHLERKHVREPKAYSKKSICLDADFFVSVIEFVGFANVRQTRETAPEHFAPGFAVTCSFQMPA